MLEHPLDLGETSAIEKGPWHYGADYIAVYFKGDAELLQALVPQPFVVEDGTCIAYVCEIVSVADNGREMVSSMPDRTFYNEAAIGVKCSFKKRTGVFYPVMWVTTEWSLLRGLVNGYQKRLADRISMSKLHPLNPALGPIGPGTTLAGYCMKGASQKLSIKVKIERQGLPSDLISFGSTFGMRKFPQTEPSQGKVEEPVEILKSNYRVSDVWLGSGSLETELKVGKINPIFGAVYRSGFTISGSRVLV